MVVLDPGAGDDLTAAVLRLVGQALIEVGRGEAETAAATLRTMTYLCQRTPGRPAEPAADHRWADLTPRERDVVRLAAQGLTNKAIASSLYLSRATVRNYLSTAFAKLGVSRRAQLAGVIWNTDGQPGRRAAG